MKKSITIIELIFIIIIISFIYTQVTFKKQTNDLKSAAHKIKLYLNYTRYIAHIDNKYDIEDNEWFKKLWTMKFQRCKKSVGGLYFVIYSDTSGGTAHFKKSETLKDPLSNKYLYSNSNCETAYDESKYILLTKQYGIENIDLSCNMTDSLGQISFGYEGKVFGKLGSSPKEIESTCFLKIIDAQGSYETITIEPYTGYIH